MPEAPASVPEETLARQAQSVSSEFHHEVERQQRELQQFQNQSAIGDPAPRVEDEMTEVAPVESFVSRQRLQPEASGTAVEYQQANVASARESQEVISGPSFLGLSEETAPDSKLDYLYEDDPRRSGGARYWLAALIAIGFIGFVLYELKQNWNWDTTIIGRHRQQQTDSANPANGSAANPGVQNSTTPEQPAAATPNQEKQGTAETKTSPQSASSNSDPNQPKPDEQSAPHPESTGGNSVAGGVAAPVADGGNGPPQDGRGAADSASQDLKNQAKTGKWPPNAQPPDIQDENAAEQANETADANVPAKPEKPNERERSNRARTESGKSGPAAYSSRQPDEVLVTKADAYLYGRGVPKNCDQ
ncbi:MAG TPA: hypothetical protein VFM10_11615, partial [Terriglobales bacterium]|nr:hypothetical protein [Terriglobales bacterium]